VLGPTEDVPGRVLPVRRVLSARPLFDHNALRLYRWIAERYVTPLAVAIGRAHPPRVASEEEVATPPAGPTPVVRPPRVLSRYGHGDELLEACRRGDGAFVVRPLPDEEASACLEAVAACVAGGRSAVVVVPEAIPLPATAGTVAEAFGPSCLVLVGGDRRERYRAWLDALDGRYRVVVGTRPAVFAPVPRVGLVWVSRDAHPGHREERAPYHHVRDVALARARIEGAVGVVAGLVPSGEAAAMTDEGSATLVRADRSLERTSAPLVETARPGPEDRSTRLAGVLRGSGGAFLMLSRQGFGVVRVCRSCGEPVRCTTCSGPVAVKAGVPACTVCGATASCGNCGSTRFGVERGGTERLAEWAGRVSGLPVERVETGEDARPPRTGRVMVGTAAAVKDFGPLRVPLVGILDPDRARRRAGLGAAEQALATWMEAAAWAGSRADPGRVLAHTGEPGDPAIQALVRWDPWHFHRAERRRRRDAGFPPGFPVFRIAGGPTLPEELAALRPVNLLTSSAEGETVSLVTVRPQSVPRLRERLVALAQEGTVTRVEAEPHL
jgi:primosomal protein N' (replication factor Y)